MRSLSVVVTADSATASAVRSLVAEWTRARITEPSLWVRGSDVVDTEGQPPQVTAWVITADGEEKVDLFAYLGRFRLERVRVVAAQLAASTEDVDPQVSALGNAVADLIRQALPRDPSGTDLTRLHRTLLLVPASEVRGIDSRVLLPAWEANVVISPEDRPDLDRSSVFVRPSTNYAGHAAAAVSAAAGLIRGVPTGAFDAVSTDSSARPDDVVVARVSVRTVVGEDVLDVLIRRVLHPAELEPVGFGQVVSWAAPASDPQLVVQRATRAVLASTEWAPSPNPDLGEPQEERQELTSAFARAARFNLSTAAAAPAWSFSRGRDVVDHAATTQVVGTDAGAVVTVGPRAVDRMGEVAQDILEARRLELAEHLTYEATRSAPPAPTTWSSLRELCFALADGGPVEAIETPRQLGQREVLEPHHIAPRPGAVLTTRDGTVIEATDPAGMRAYLAHLEELTQAPPTEQPTAGEDAAIRPDPEQAREDLATYREWFEAHSASILWQVGDDVAQRLTTCEKNRQTYRDSGNVTAPATADLDVAKKRLLRRWWITGALGVLALVILALVVSGQENPDWAEAAWWAGGIGAAVLGALVGSNHAFYKAFRRYEWKVRNALAQQRAEAARFLWYGKEHARLTVLLKGWRDWTTIIGEVVHRPWQPPSTQVHQLSEEVVDKLPAAMAVARQPEGQVDLPATLVARAYGVVYRSGWAQQAFDAAYEELASQASLTGSKGYLDVDVDSSSSAVSPRGQLLELWRLGRARSLLAGRLAEKLRVAVLSGELALPSRRVERIGSHSDGIWRDEPEYYAAVATSETTFALEVFGSVARAQNRHYARHVTVWLPRGAHSAGAEPNAAATVETAEAATAVRVDLSQRLAPQELAIFSSADTKQQATETKTASLDAFL